MPAPLPVGAQYASLTGLGPGREDPLPAQEWDVLGRKGSRLPTAVHPEVEMMDMFILVGVEGV